MSSATPAISAPTAEMVASTNPAAEKDFKIAAASTQSAAASKPIDSVINEIALAVRAQDLEKAKNLIKEKMKDNPLRERVEELVFLPFHLYIRHDFKLLCTYKSLRLQALAGDPKAQETLDSWHVVNAILDILNRGGILEKSLISDKIEVNMSGEIPIFYVNFGPTIEVTPQKTETAFGVHVNFKIKSFFNERMPPNCYEYKPTRDAKFLLFVDAINGPKVIEGKIVDGKIEVVPHRFINPDQDHIITTANLEDVPPDFDVAANFNAPKPPQTELDDVLAGVITPDELKHVRIDFSQTGMCKIMQYVKKHFCVYRHPQSGISIFSSIASPTEEILKKNARDFLYDENNGLFANINTSPSNLFFLGWTAEGEHLNTIESTHNDDKPVALPFDSNEIAYTFNAEKSTCTLVAKSQTSKSDLFSMVCNRVDWETAAVVTLGTLSRGIAVKSSFFTLSGSSFNLFSHDGNLFLERSVREDFLSPKAIFELYIQKNGAWTSITQCCETLNKTAIFESRFNNGMCVHRSEKVVQEFSLKTWKMAFLESRNYEIRIPPSIDFRPLTKIPFDINSEEDQEKYGVRSLPAHGNTSLQLQKRSPLDAMRAAYLRDNFLTLFAPYIMQKDPVTLISQYLSCFPPLKK